MSNPDCTAGCGFICTCGDVDFGALNELASENARLQHKLGIAVTALQGIKDGYDYPMLLSRQALAQIRELEK